MSTDETQSQAERVLSRFPSQAALQRELGHANGSTVSSWKARKFIPSWHQSDVLAAARRLGVDLKPEDFFEPSEAA